MRSRQQDFLKYICQTSPHPIGLEIDRAVGSYVHTKEGKRYLDFISGIGVANIGHCHPKVVSAIRTQAERYLHVMVYGEYVLSPQVDLASKLVSLLPPPLEQVYFTNSGTEANEGALKLAKKFTGRKRLIAFEESFHGDTHGACSVTGREQYRKPFEPLLPGVSFLPFNGLDHLSEIDETVAGVIIEPIQGEAGIKIPSASFLEALREQCYRVGALLIFDEAQTGFGRTGRFFAMEHWGIVPDIVTFAKGMGGGMPLGAFVGRREVMKVFSTDPPFSHVTTFGGHPVCCVAGLASLNVLIEEDLSAKAKATGAAMRHRLNGMIGRKEGIRDVRGKGLMIGLELHRAGDAARFVKRVFDAGLLLGWTLHSETVIRIMPPLNLSENEMLEGLNIIENALV
ncbi:aspartate aminotransferase family protein [Nitrospira defluvii]|nr:aspartate aminotransferase family protein [Nitrospira defluvii]